MIGTVINGKHEIVLCPIVVLSCDGGVGDSLLVLSKVSWMKATAQPRMEEQDSFLADPACPLSSVV
eukprot:2706269-Amphidinium_carterae.1